MIIEGFNTIKNNSHQLDLHKFEQFSVPMITS
jgi:hypothetical protein